MTSVHHDISTAPAAAKLNLLAAEPFDLTSEDALLQDGRLQKYICRMSPFRLFYGTQRVDDAVLDALQELADECGMVEQFKAMRRGAVLNKIEGFDSEQRQVLHTASRDLFSERPRQPEAAEQARREMAKLNRFLSELEDGSLTNGVGETFTTMVHVGIGGSDLGPRSIYEALKPFGLTGREVHFIANVDPDDAAAVLERVDLSRTLVSIVSKSGTTLETLANEQLVMARLRSAGLEPARHCIAITGQGSPMDNPEHYLRSFHMFDYIGGRYSSTSMVGCVMLGFFMGYKRLCQFLEGAARVDEAAENGSILENLPLLLALLGIWNHNFLEAATLAILPYSQALHRFPAHLQQCDMESNGKSITRQGRAVDYKSGPVIWGEPGTNGQHAFYQLLHQGTEVVPVEFIGFLQNQRVVDIPVEGTSSQDKLVANLLAQSIAFAAGKRDVNPNRRFAGNRPSSLLMAERLTPAVMGGLLAIYEAKIVFQGFAWNINSFDQEGVQLGKVLATKILAEMSGSRGGDGSVESCLLDLVVKGK